VSRPDNKSPSDNAAGGAIKGLRILILIVRQRAGDLMCGLRRSSASGVHDKVGRRDQPRPPRPVLGQVSKAPGLCFAGALNALAEDSLVGVEHDMEYGEPGAAQAPANICSRYARARIVCGAMRCWPVKRVNSVAVATTSGRHGGQCWKSGTGWSARLGPSMEPTVSGSNRRLAGIRGSSSAAVVVLPQPKAPFSQTITWSCYEHPHSHSVIRAWSAALPVSESASG
jgi:hypothetical protein